MITYPILPRTGPPGWVWMWIIVLSFIPIAKAITITRFLLSGGLTSIGRLLGYTFLWPGMDPDAFLGHRKTRHSSVPSHVTPDTRNLTPDTWYLTPVSLEQWILALLKTDIGAIIVWGVVPLVGPAHPLLTGWVGMW